MYQVVRKVPVWLNGKKYAWLVQALVALLLLVGPFLDEIVGMRQFEKLCANNKVSVSPQASAVRRAREEPFRMVSLKGYWVEIKSHPVSYIDLDTGNPFISYSGFHTKGGRVAGIALLGGEHSCWPKDRIQTLQQLHVEKLIEQGENL